MIKINLNPRKKGAITKAGAKRKFGLELPSIKAPSLKIKGIVFIAIPLIILGLEAFYYLNLDFSLNKLRNEISAVDNQIRKYKLLSKNLEQLQKQIEEQRKLKESIRTQILVFQKFAIQKGDILRMFESVATSMPDGIWLTKMNLDKNTYSVELDGYSFNPKLITRFMNNLGRYYSSISFSSTKRVEGKVVDFYSFNLRLANWKLKKKKNNKPQELAKVNTNKE